MSSDFPEDADPEGHPARFTRHYPGSHFPLSRRIRLSCAPGNFPGPDGRRRVGCEHLELLGGARTKVQLGGLRVSISQPQRDLPDVPGSVQGSHSRGVAQHMRGHALGSKRRNSPPGRGDMQIEAVREAVPTHRTSAGVEDAVPVANRRPHLQPLAEHGPGLLPQRQCAFASALAQNADALESRLRQAVERKRCQFPHMQPRSVAEMQHGTVAQPQDRAGVGGIEHSLRLRHTVSFEVRGVSGCGPLPSADMTVSRRSLMGFWLVPPPNQERTGLEVSRRARDPGMLNETKSTGLALDKKAKRMT